MWIMIAGPYRTGASSESERHRNLGTLNRAAFEVFRKGHVPIIGVNLALPIIEAAGDETYESVMMPGADAKVEDNKGKNVLCWFVAVAGASISTRFSHVPGKEAFMEVVRRFVAAGVDTSRAWQDLTYWRARQSNEFFGELEGVLSQPTKL